MLWSSEIAGGMHQRALSESHRLTRCQPPWTHIPVLSKSRWQTRLGGRLESGSRWSNLGTFNQYIFEYCWSLSISHPQRRSTDSCSFLIMRHESFVVKQLAICQEIKILFIYQIPNLRSIRPHHSHRCWCQRSYLFALGIELCHGSIWVYSYFCIFIRCWRLMDEAIMSFC